MSTVSHLLYQRYEIPINEKTNGLFVILDHSDFILGISKAFIYIVQNVKKDCVQFCILVIAYE